MDVIPNIFIHSISVSHFLINKWLKIIIRAATDWFSEDVQTAGSGRPTEITCEILSSMMRASCFNLWQRVLTSPTLQRSGQRCSSRAPPWTSASAGSANRPRSGWREELHRQTANPGKEEGKWRHLPGFSEKPKQKKCEGWNQLQGNKSVVGEGDSWRGFLPVSYWLHVKLL